MGRDVSIETLIAIAKENINNKNTSVDLDEVTKFILFFKIKEGKNKIFSEILYKAYCMWSKEKMSYLSFCRLFSKHFESKRGKTKNNYLLNYQPAQLLNEAAKWKVEE